MKIYSRLLSLAALLVTTFSVARATEPVKIFILAGQSNMVGHGNMTPGTAINTLEHLVNPANDTAGGYQFLVDGTGWKSWDDVWIHYARSGGTVNGTMVAFSQGIPSGGMLGVSADISGKVPDRVSCAVVAPKLRGFFFSCDPVARCDLARIEG